LIGGWKGGNPVEIQKRPENLRYGKEYPMSTFSRERVPYEGQAVSGAGLTGSSYGSPYDETGVELSDRVHFPYARQFAQGSFNYIPPQQIPEDYLFPGEAGVLGAHTPSQLRGELRKMDDPTLRKYLFGREMPREHSGSSVGDITGAMRGRVDLDPAWSVAYQHYLDRTASERPQVLASRGPLSEDDGIVSLGALQRARQ